MGFNLAEESKPTTPSTGKVRLYNKSNELYMVKDDGTEQKAIIGSSPGGTFTVSNKTSNYTITSSDADDYTLLTNSGATSDITFTLPSATAGYRVYVCNLTDDYSINIQSNTGDFILKYGNPFSEVFCNYKYDIVTLTAIDSTNWMVEYNTKPLNIKFDSLTNTEESILALDINGYFWAWGYKQYGEGLAPPGYYNYPYKYDDVTFVNISATIRGQRTVLGLDSNGQAWGWGYAYYGSTGTGDYFGVVTVAKPVCGGHTFCQIAASYDYHSVAIDHNGQAWAWGYNNNGQLGINSTAFSTTAVQVCGGHTFCKVSGGNLYSVAIDHNGQAWTWGSNYYGQLGDNTTTSKSTPVQVCGGHTFCYINCGQYHTVAIDQNGQAWTWGSNTNGRLGDNSTTNKSTPVQVCGGHTFCQISAGHSNTVAIDQNGQAWTWGVGAYGRLGDNSISNKSTPVQVCGGHTFCQISGGYNFSSGVDNNNQLWFWGKNERKGPYPRGTSTCYMTPILINKIT